MLVFPRIHQNRQLSAKTIVQWALLGLVALFLAGCAGVDRGTVDITDFNRVVVDAGHGGHDSGAISRGRRRIAEKEMALDLARRLERHLQNAGFQTEMTRTGDRFVSLDERVAISNRRRKSLFVSIHFNDSRKRGIHGAEIYHNGVGTYGLAAKLEHSLNRVPGCRVRFAKTASYRVLRKSNGPAVLLECGYLSSPAELARCMRAEYRERMAAAIAQAIVEQRGGPPGAAASE